MSPHTNYDEVAPAYDQRYAHNAYPGLTATVLDFVGRTPQRVLEIGCGSGHWLSCLSAHGHDVFGLDASSGMLMQAKHKVGASRLAHGRAEALPFAAESFDRVLLVHALHHFEDPRRAMREARRVLRASGSLLTIGLDPSSAEDTWCIYDFFSGTRERDRQRFPTANALHTWLNDAGFARCRTTLAELFELHVPAREALSSGALSRHSTSQLTELSDEAYASGIAAIVAADAAAAGALLLHARLHLFGTLAHAASTAT